MALPSSGLISLSAINVELGRAANAPISLNDPDVRNLLIKPSGAIGLSDAHGKSLAQGSTIVTGYVNSGGEYYGWSPTTQYGVPIIGSATPNPIPITSVGGVLYSLLWFPGYQFLYGYASTNAGFVVKINGVSFTMHGEGLNGGAYFVDCYESVFTSPFNPVGQSNTITFG